MGTDAAEVDRAAAPADDVVHPVRVVLSAAFTRNGQVGLFAERAAFLLAGHCVIPKLCALADCGDKACLGLPSSCRLCVSEEPTRTSCWRAACRWFLDRPINGERPLLLRVVESGKLDASQDIETQIAREVGARVLDVHVSALPSYLDKVGSSGAIHEYLPSHSRNASASSRDFGVRVRLATTAGLKTLEEQMLASGLVEREGVLI